MKENFMHRSSYRSVYTSGFTLIELLSIITVIMLLLGILFPVLRSTIKQSKLTSCIGNLKQIGQGFFLYSKDYRGILPTPPVTSPAIMCERSNPPYGYAAGLGLIVIGDYITPFNTEEKASIFFCPMVPKDGQYGASYYNLHNIVTLYTLKIVTGLPVSSYFYRIKQSSSEKNLSIIRDTKKYILADKFGDGTECSHKNGYNVLYVNGAVQFIKLKSSEINTVKTASSPYISVSNIFDSNLRF